MEQQESHGGGAGVDDDARSPLYELAALAPATAIEAALALCRSAEPASREAGARLGARVVGSQGSRPSQSKAMAGFCAKMLGGPEEAALAFLGQAPDLLRKLGSKLADKLTPERMMALERASPGFAANLGPQTLGRHPALAGALAQAGLIPGKKAFEIQCEAGARAYVAAAQGESTRQVHEAIMRDLVASKAFGPDMEKACPGWSRRFWEEFWAMPLAKRLAGGKPMLDSPAAHRSRRALHCLLMPTGAGAVEAAPPIDGLSPREEERLLDLAQAMQEGCSPEAAKAWGAYLARASDKQLEAWRRAERADESNETRLMHNNRGDAIEWRPLNASARVLLWMRAGGSAWEQKADRRMASRAESWLAFAEGLAQAGAPPPEFEPAPREAKLGAPPRGPALLAWPVGMVGRLGPALCLAGQAASPTHPALEWIGRGADPREAAALRAWMDKARKAAGPAVDEQAGAMARMLDGLEVAASAPSKAPSSCSKAAAPQPARPRL